MFPSQFANIFLTFQIFVTNLHAPRVELSCKLREKMHRVTEPLERSGFSCRPITLIYSFN